MSRVEVAQAQVPDLARVAKIEEVLEGDDEAPVTVLLPEELGAVVRCGRVQSQTGTGS